MKGCTARRPYLSRQQAMERGFKITRRLLELKEELGWSYEEVSNGCYCAPSLIRCTDES